MCGIVGAVARRDVASFLLQGLRRLEYRGYDSAGVVVINPAGQLDRLRAVGRVGDLEQSLGGRQLKGHTGLGHTRWATHGGVTEPNAHPHICRNSLALVCNGIVENYEALKHAQRAAGLRFSSDTDTEVVVHQIYLHMSSGMDLVAAVRATMAELKGSFALGVVHVGEPGRLVAARQGPPLLIGVAKEQHLVASDISALLPVTSRYLVLEKGDIADIRQGSCRITDRHGDEVDRPVQTSQQDNGVTALGNYQHYMQKEIFEQPRAVADTLEGRLAGERMLEEVFGPDSTEIFNRVRAVQILACGTSYHAGLVGRHWLEYVGVPCNVEIASEFRYRRHALHDDTLVVTISQSGETADTLAALEETQRLGMSDSLTICNSPESSLVRESSLTFLTHAGPEICVASSKTFVTSLAALMMLALAFARRRGYDAGFETHIVNQLRALPAALEEVLLLDPAIKALAPAFARHQNALFLGRGAHYPIALEGALKLKEISYIHAEAYPAGELKHGPLALVDKEMPVVAVAPNDELLEKLKSNIQEVRARGGRLFVFADPNCGFKAEKDFDVLHVAPVDSAVAPIIYAVPLQLLAYHVALIKGTDVDKPRNLAKSVTVE